MRLLRQRRQRHLPAHDRHPLTEAPTPPWSLVHPRLLTPPSRQSVVGRPTFRRYVVGGIHGIVTIARLTWLHGYRDSAK